MERAYKIQWLIGGEWSNWSETYLTFEEANRIIFQNVAMAKSDESAKDINRWRAIRVLPHARGSAA